MELRLRERHGAAVRCPLCHDELRPGEGWRCPRCGTEAHAACIRLWGGCPVLGCPSAPSTLCIRVAERVVWSWRWAVLFLVLLCIVPSSVCCCVVPAFEKMYHEPGTTIPPLTEGVLFVANVAHGGGWVLLFLAHGLAVLLASYRLPRWRATIDSLGVLVLLGIGGVVFVALFLPLTHMSTRL